MTNGRHRAALSDTYSTYIYIYIIYTCIHYTYFHLHLAEAHTVTRVVRGDGGVVFICPSLPTQTILIIIDTAFKNVYTLVGRGLTRRYVLIVYKNYDFLLKYEFFLYICRIQNVTILSNTYLGYAFDILRYSKT